LTQTKTKASSILQKLKSITKYKKHHLVRTIKRVAISTSSHLPSSKRRTTSHQGVFQNIKRARCQ
jgi:hypothetical protein